MNSPRQASSMPPLTPPPMPPPPPTLRYATPRDALFTSGHQRAVLTMWLLVASTAVIAGSIVSDIMQLNLLDQMQRGAQPPPAQITANDQRQGAIAVVSVGLMIAALVLFLMWVHRVYGNLRILRHVPPRWTPAWAVGYFFIPILNFFRPYQVVSEVWEGSRSQEDPGPSLVGAWWVMWLASGFVERAIARAGKSADAVTSLIAETRGSIAGSILAVIAGICAIVMVRRINQMQARATMHMAPLAGGRAAVVAPPIAAPVVPSIRTSRAMRAANHNPSHPMDPS